MSLSDSSVKHDRGALFLNRERLKVWGQVTAISREQDRDEPEVLELMTEVTRLAIGQYLATKTDGGARAESAAPKEPGHPQAKSPRGAKELALIGRADL